MSGKSVSDENLDYLIEYGNQEARDIARDRKVR